ncbi:MAG TPA: hypothetical protein DEV85_06205 [Vibrio sp.]|uniref:hypothetical protein n=1 Tax=Vibrio sp. TaxID=678 RepID=UPI000EE8863F|nr:hypothetical protein [Vibrio sp.]HCH01465.1 hypothetical protein [Vibrio sp.]
MIYLLAKPAHELQHFKTIEELKKVVSDGDTVTTLYPDGSAIQAEWQELPAGEPLAHHMAEIAFYHEAPTSTQMLEILDALKGDDIAVTKYIQLMTESYQETADRLSKYEGA